MWAYCLIAVYLGVLDMKVEELLLQNRFLTAFQWDPLFIKCHFIVEARRPALPKLEVGTSCASLNMKIGYLEKYE